MLYLSLVSLARMREEGNVSVSAVIRGFGFQTQSITLFNLIFQQPQKMTLSLLVHLHELRHFLQQVSEEFVSVMV